MTDFQSRIESTASILTSFAQNQGMTVTGDRRISEKDAAKLLGLNPAYLKNLRQEGKGPVPYNRGMAGCRISYRIIDLAEWIEQGRAEFFS